MPPDLKRRLATAAERLGGAQRARLTASAILVIFLGVLVVTLVLRWPAADQAGPPEGSTPSTGPTTSTTPSTGAVSTSVPEPPDDDSGSSTTTPTIPVTPDWPFADARTTGPDDAVVLEPVPPDVYWVVDEDVDGVAFSGMLVIGGPDITISNSLITATTDAFGIWNPDGHPGVVVDRVEIRCVGDGIKPTSAGITNVSRVTRTEVTGCADGIKVTSDTAIIGNYIHDLATGPGIHSDGIQMQGGTNLLIEGNTIVALARAGANSAVFLQSESAPISGVMVRDNYLSGFGFTVRLNGERITDTVVEDNVIGPGARFGPILFSGGAELVEKNNRRSGNVDLNGSPLD